MPTPLEFSLVANFVLFIGLIMSLLNRKKDIDLRLDLIAKDNRIDQLESALSEAFEIADKIDQDRINFNRESV